MVLETVFLIAAIAGAIWVIYDVLKHQKKLSTEGKAVWIIAALLFSIITAIVYYLVKKKK
jgi:hypothetical protein